MFDTNQLDLLGRPDGENALLTPRSCRRGSFTDNMRLPVHRWFRYSAGFSADWVRAVVAERRSRFKRNFCVLDPFAGAGTSLLSAGAEGAHAIGVEHHPFVARIARAKIRSHVDPRKLLAAESAWVGLARSSVDSVSLESAPDLLRRCYSDEHLRALEALRLTWHEVPNRDPEIRELLWLALTAVLRPCSGVGTAQWQYVLPSKVKARTKEPFYALREKVKEMAIDIMGVWSNSAIPNMEMREADARESSSYIGVEYDLVVTSPPYPNNYDYADATRIEMTFWREISGWGDLHSAVRNRLVRSCSQHSAADKLALADLLNDPAIAPILSELRSACERLAEVRLQKGGKKTYHTMIAAYFVDLAKVLESLAACRKKDAEVCMVIGDSAPYGVHVPAERWLSELAIAAGFTSCRFEKIRDRNMKWKNRKHRVPLKEGFLWLR